ncbi:TPA: PRD domain-containing protein [Salmonella enterica]|nr:PRD domain-containing protein [Salmonella enterica]
MLGRQLEESEREVRSVADVLPHEEHYAPDDPFTSLIGYDRSLRDAVEKGRAAVLYPHGLHVLLTGPSGVGKTFFAELMHRFACEQASGAIPPLVYFNCAEYAHNPELLSSHLFGHRQGAFTGANEHKTGLVEQADGGYLLLDEVHRLSYEGQEKLFSILDKGEYRPLGVSSQPRSISVRLICATTEPVGSALLRTFQRRIQVCIDLPGIRQRSVEEQIELIVGFLQRESRKIERTVSIDKPLLLWLLNKPLEGNIGQLKSDIQFLCAQAWASGMTEHNDTLQLDKRLAGIVGTFQPGLPDIPFISLEELFSEQGPELVLSLLTPDLSNAERRLEMERSAMRFISALTMESIINHISVLNPQRILKEMEGVFNHLTSSLSLKPSRQVTLRFLIHCCCMVERIVINRKPLQMALESQPNLDARAFSVIKSAFLPIEDAYAIRLSDAEYFYIYELLYS